MNLFDFQPGDTPQWFNMRVVRVKRGVNLSVSYSSTNTSRRRKKRGWKTGAGQFPAPA